MTSKPSHAAPARRKKGSQPAADPAFVAVLLQQGRSLAAAGRDEEAVETAKLLIGLDQSREARDFFVDCVKGWTYFPGAENLRDVFVRALREAWARPSVLFGIAFGILERSPVIGPAMRRAAAAWPRRAPRRAGW